MNIRITRLKAFIYIAGGFGTVYSVDDFGSLIEHTDQMFDQYLYSVYGV